MTEVGGLVREAESAGIEILLDREDKVRVRYAETHQEQLVGLLAQLRSHRNDVATVLRERQGVSAPPECPPLPPGVRLIRYAPKTPPIAVQHRHGREQVHSGLSQRPGMAARTREGPRLCALA